LAPTLLIGVLALLVQRKELINHRVKTDMRRDGKTQAGLFDQVFEGADIAENWCQPGTHALNRRNAKTFMLGKTQKITGLLEQLAQLVIGRIGHQTDMVLQTQSPYARLQFCQAVIVFAPRNNEM